MLYDEDNENEFEEDFGLTEDEKSYNGFNEDDADFGEIDSVSDPLESSDPLDADYLDNDDHLSPESSDSDYTSDTPIGAEQSQGSEDLQGVSHDDLIALYRSDLTQTGDKQATAPTGAEQPQEYEGSQGRSDEDLITLYRSDLTGQKEIEEEYVPQLEDAASVSGYEDPVYAHERALRNAIKMSGLQENAEVSIEELAEQSIKKEQEYRNENYYKNLFLEYGTAAANANTEQEWKDAMTKAVNLRLAQEEDNNIIAAGIPTGEMYEYGVDRREKNYMPSFDSFIQLKANAVEEAIYATTFFDRQGDNESVNRLQTDHLSLFNDEADLTEEGLAVAQGIARLVGASGDESLAESLGSDVESLEKFKAAENPETAEKIVLSVANSYRLSATARQAFERAQRNDNWENLKGLSLDDAVNARAFGIADRRRNANVLEKAMPDFVNTFADKLNPIIKNCNIREDFSRFIQDINLFGKSDEELAAQRAQIDRSIIHTLQEGFAYNERGDLVLTPAAQKKLSSLGLADFNDDADANAPLFFTEKHDWNWITPRMRGSIIFNAVEVDATCSEFGVTREAFLKSFKMSMGRRLTANAEFARGGSLAADRIDIDENGNRKRVFGVNIASSSTSLYNEANIKAAEEYIRSKGGTDEDVKNFYDERLELLGDGMREREFEDHIKHATGFADWWKKVQSDKPELSADEQKDFALTYWGENQGTLDAAWQWGKEMGSLIVGGVSTMVGQAIKAVVSTPSFLLATNAQVAQACFEAMGFASAARIAESVNDFAVRTYDDIDKSNFVSSTLNEWGSDLTEAGSRFDEEYGKVYGLTKGLAVFGADVMIGGGVGGVVKAGARAAIRQAAAATARGATKRTMTQLAGKKLIESAFQKTVKAKGFQTSIAKTARELGLDEVAALENTTKYLASLDLSAVVKEYGEYVSRGLAKTAGKDLPNNLTTAFANTAVQDIVFKALPRTAEQLAASKGVTGYFVGKAGADYISGFEKQKTEEAIEFYCTTHGIKRDDYEKTVDEETRNDLERKARSRAFVSGYLGTAAAMAVSFYCNFKLEEHVSVIGKKLGSGVEKRLASGIGSMPMAATDATFKRLYGGVGPTVGDMLEALTSRGLTRSASILVASRIMGTTLANTFRSGTSEAINEVADGLTSYFITTLGQRDVESLDAAEAFSQALEGGILGFLGGSISHNVSHLLPRPKASAESIAKFGGSKNIFLNEQWEKINKAGQAGQDLITKRQVTVRRQIRELETQIRNGENTEENSKTVTRLKAVEAELAGLHWTDVTPMKIARLFDGDDTVAQKLLDLQRAANKAGLRYIAMTAQAEAEDRASGLQHWLKKNAGTPIAALYEAQWNALNVENIETQRELGVFEGVPQTLDGIEEMIARMQELIQRDAERKDQLIAKGELTEAEQHELEQINTIQVAAEKYAEYLTNKQRTLSEAERARLDEENTRISEAETEAGKAAEKASLLGKRIADNNKTISKIEKQNEDARQRKEAIQSEIAELESELGVATDETVRETLTQRISEKQGEIAEIDAAMPKTAESLATLRENNNKLYADHLAATRATTIWNRRASKLASSNYRLLANVETVVNKTSSDLKEAQEELEKIQYELAAVTGRTEEEEIALRSREEVALKKIDEARAAMQDVQNLYLRNADAGLLGDMAQVGMLVSNRAEDVDGSMTLANSNPFADGTQAHMLYEAIVREVQKSATKKEAKGMRINALTDRLIKASGLERSSTGIVKDCVVTPVLKAFESAGLIQYQGKESFIVNAKSVEQPSIPESPSQVHVADYIPAATIAEKNARTVDAWTPVGNSVSSPKTTQVKPSDNAGDVRRRIEEAADADAQQPHISYETIMRDQLRNRSPRFGEENEETFNQLFDKVVSLLITENGVSSVREKDISAFIDGIDVDAETKQKLATEYLNEITYALGLEKQGDVYKVRLTSENEAEFAEAISKLEKMHGKAFNPLANVNTMRAFSQSVDDARGKVSDEMLEELQALGMATDGSYTSLSDPRFIETMRKVYGDSPSVDVFERMCNWLNEAGVLGDVFIRPVINDPLVENGIGGVNFQEGRRNGHHQYVVEINVSKGFNANGAFLQTLVHEVGHSFFSEVAFKNDKISSALADVAIEARTQILANQQAILAQFRTQFWMLPPDMRNRALIDLENMLYGVGLRLETTTATNPDGTPEYSFSFSDENMRWQPQEFYTVAISNRMMNWAMKLVGARADAAEQELRDLVSGRQFLGLIMGSYDYGENRDEDERMWNDLLALIDQMSDIERSGDPASVASLEVVARSINKGIKESMSQEERAIIESASGIGENNIGYGYSYNAGTGSSSMYNAVRNKNEYARDLKREFNKVYGDDLSYSSFNAMARNAGYDTRTAERNINVDTALKENNGVLEASNGTIVDLRGDNPTAMFNIAARQAGPTHGIRKESTEFIGSGEGNQTYGWGLYFSTSKKVHSYYAESLGRKEIRYTFAETKKQEVKFDEKAKRLVGDKYKDGEYEYAHVKGHDFNVPVELISSAPGERTIRDNLRVILKIFRFLGKNTIAALSGEEAIEHNGKLLTLDELRSELSSEISKLEEDYDSVLNRYSEAKDALHKALEKSEQVSELPAEALSLKEKVYAIIQESRGMELLRETLKNESQIIEDVIYWSKNSNKADVALCFAMNPGFAERLNESYKNRPNFSPVDSILDGVSDLLKREKITRSAQYEVELNADDSNLLLYDRPLSEQNETVQRLATTFIENEIARIFSKVFSKKKRKDEIDKMASSGGDFYDYVLVPAYGSPKAASEWLLENGIKGIKYLDGFSRKGDSNATYNYVVFSGDDVQITRYNDETSNFEWTDYYDETANFPREGIRPMFNRVSSQRGGTSSVPITTSHPVFDNLTGRTAKRQMDTPYKPITIGGETYSYQTLPPDPVFNLIGSRAKTWGKLFDEGRRPFRSQDGKMKMEINADTCVWKTEFVGEDGKTYKYESPWKRVPIIGNLLSWGNFMPVGESFKIGEVLDYPELFEAYPHLKDLKVQRAIFLGAYGAYDIDEKLIQFNSTLSLDTARSVLLHELQHAIQDYEGFASGGDQRNTWRFIIDSMTGDIIKTDLPEDLRLSEEERAQKLLWMQEDWDNSGDWRAAIRKNITDTRRRLLFQGRDSGGYIYKRLLGEVEARTVQKRRNYTVEQRKEIPFEADYDVALNEIVLSFETRYDWLSYFSRTKTEESLYRQHVSNVKQEVRNLLDEGKPKTANIVWRRLVAEDKARKQRELFDRNATDVRLENGVMFNIVGPKSMGFDKNTEGVFEARDGTLRRELDSSEAKVKDIYVPPSVYTKDYVNKHIEKAINASKIKEGLSFLEQCRSKYYLAQNIKWQMAGELSSGKYEELAAQQDQLNRELLELSSYNDREKLSPLAKAAMRLANDELAASGYNRNQMLWKNKGIMDSFIHALVSGTTGSYKRAITNLFGKFRPSGVFTKKLSEVLDYPALYEAYPQLKDLEVRIGNNKVTSGLGKYSIFKNGPSAGWYDSVNNYIQLNPLVGGAGTPGPLASKLTLIHEIQHWIQNYEGWYAGGTGTSALPDDEYWVAPEEVEARTVEMRSIMPENELAELTWLDTYGLEEYFSRNAKNGYYNDLYYEAQEQDSGESQVGFNDEPVAMFNRVDFREEGPEVARKAHKELVDTINATADYKDVYPLDREMSPERIFKAIFIGDFLNRQDRLVAKIPNHKIYQATLSNGFNKKRFTSSDVTDSFVFALVSALSDAKSQGRKVPEELLNTFNSLKDKDDLEDFKTLIKTFITNPLVEVSGSDAGAAILGGFSRLIGLNSGLEISGIDTMEKTVPGVFMHLNEHMVNMQKRLGGRNKKIFSNTLVQRQRKAGVFTRDFHLLSMKAIPARIRKMLGLNWRNVESGEQVAAELKNLVRSQELSVDLGRSVIHTFNDRFDQFLKAAKTKAEQQERTTLVGHALGSNRALYDKKEFDAIDREYNAELRRAESEYEIVTRNTKGRYDTIFSKLENTRQKTREEYDSDIMRRKQNGASEVEIKRIEEKRDRALQEIDDKNSLAEASLNEEIKRAEENRQLQKQAAKLESVNKKDGVRNRIGGEIRATQKAARERLEYMSRSGDIKATEMLQAIDEARRQIDRDMDVRAKNDRAFAEASRGAEGIYLPRLYLASLKGEDESKKRFKAIKESKEGNTLYDLRERIENRVAENVAIKNTEGFYKDWTARLSESAALTSYMKDLEHSGKAEDRITKKALEESIAKISSFMSKSFTVAKLLTKDKNEINYYKTFAPEIIYGKDKKTIIGDSFNEAWAKSYVYRLITHPILVPGEVDFAEKIQEQERDKDLLRRYGDTAYTAVLNAINAIENAKKNSGLEERKKEAVSALKADGSARLLRVLGLNGLMNDLKEAYQRTHAGESPTQAELIREVAEELVSLSDNGKRPAPTGNELIDGWLEQSYSIVDSYALMPSTRKLLRIGENENENKPLTELKHDTVIESFIAKLEDYAMSRGYVDGINRKELHDKIVSDVRKTNKDYLWSYVQSLFFNDDSTDLNTRHDLPLEYMQMLGAQLLDNAESIKDTVHSGVARGLRESTGIDFYKRFIDIANNLQDQGFAFTSKPTEEQAAAFGHKVFDYVDLGDRENGWVPKGVNPITSTLYVLNTVVEDARRVYDAFQNNTDKDSTVIAAEKSQLFNKGLRKIINVCNAMPLISGITPTIRNFMGMIPMVVVPTGVNKARLASSAYTAARTCALFLDSITKKSRRAEFFARLDAYKEMGVVETNALYTIRHSDWSTLEEVAVRTKGNLFNNAIEAIEKAQLFMGKVYSLPDSLGKIISYEANFADLCDFQVFKPEYEAAVARANADGITENMIISNHALLKNYMPKETFDTISGTARERMAFEQPSSATTPDWIHSRIPIYKDDSRLIKGWKTALNTFTQINGPFMMFHYNMLRSVIKNFQFGLNDLQEGLRKGDLFGQAWSGVNRICSGAALLVQPLTTIMVPGNIAQTIFKQVILALMNAWNDDDDGHKWKAVGDDNSALIMNMIDAGVMEDYWDTQDGIVIYRINEEGTYQFATVMTDFVNPYSSYTSTVRHIVNAYKTGDWMALQKAARSLLGPLCDHHLFLQRALNADKYVDRRDVALPKGYGQTDIKTSFLGVIGGLAFDDPKIFLDEDVRLSQESAKLASFLGFLSPDIVKRAARALSSLEKKEGSTRAAILGAIGFGSIYPKNSLQRLVSRYLKMENAFQEYFYFSEFKENYGDYGVSSPHAREQLVAARARRDKMRSLFIKTAEALGVAEEFIYLVSKRSKKVKPAGASKEAVYNLKWIEPRS